MQTWRLVLVGAALGAAAIAMVVHDRSNPFERGGGDAIAAPRMDSRQQSLAADDSITPSITPSKDTRDSSKTSDSEYGWGPFRLVDW